MCTSGIAAIIGSPRGINQREADVNVAFQEAITRIISLKPDVTIIAGDLFHAVRPSNTVVTFCFRQLRRLAKRERQAGCYRWR